MYNNYIKRFFDLICSLILLISLFPFFLLIIILLAYSNKGRPFFFQLRAGKDERIFNIIKFKTMTGAKDKEGNLLPDNERITTLGKFIRKTSIDELPQIYNVLIGQMSFVGPRPFIAEYLPLYSDVQRRRHEVKPGITGWAQVNGRNTLTWKQKFGYDLFYVNNQSFSFDLKILFLTILKIIKREEVNLSNTQTMNLFNGNN